MAGFFNKLRTASTGNSNTASTSSPKNKKEEPAPELTPLERLLQNTGPPREDGSDKFFGLENFGNTCYCNSIVQALYYSESFRDNVAKYPPFSPSDTPNGKPAKVNVTIRAPPQVNGNATAPGKGQKQLSSAQALKQRQQINAGQVQPGGQPVRPEDKPDSPEYKKKQAMIKGPVLELATENPGAYGMEECTFTGLKDIFQALIESNTRTGVLSPQRFLEIFKRDNEMFRNSMHQDAHEFYGLVLNDVIANVEANAKRLSEREIERSKDGLSQSVETALGVPSALQKSRLSGTASPGTGWVHDIFEGVLTSETRCLTCETTSQRDETFLDLSIDLEEHSSVTSCLQKFSAEEMLCERNKFHCDHCGGLQEAEKRMKVKKLPRVLALHLKRFKYTEDYSRLQKLFHRVVYPYYLRMFNTTDDAEDQDRMYELYAVVVHIGGNAYHGHYVSVIKTQDRGWLLFDDEMVEPVDKHFVRNFFGDKPGMACAYVLFYQETTFEKMREEQDAEGLEEVLLASQKADLVLDPIQTNGIGSASLSKIHSTAAPLSPIEVEETMVTLNHACTAPSEVSSPILSTVIDTPLPSASLPLSPVVEKRVEDVPEIPVASPRKPKEDKSRVKKELKAQEKELKAQEKAWKAAQKEQAKLEEKKRMDSHARLLEARRSETEQMAKALQESRQTADDEERQRKRAATAAGEPPAIQVNGERSDKGPVAFLNRASRGSKSMSRKSFAFLAKGDREKEKEKEKEREKERDRPERSSTTAEGSSSRPNGSGASASTAATSTTTTNDTLPEPPGAASSSREKAHDSKPLKERFSFGRKKGERLLS